MDDAADLHTHSAILNRGMNAEETAYMRGGKEPVAGSVPMSTSKYLNSPLFVHAYSLMSLRKAGPDVPLTYDIPTMSRALADVADGRALFQAVEMEKAKNPQFAAWLARRRLTRYDPAEMGHYKPGTLGATIRDFIVSSGYQLDFINKGTTPNNDIEYIMKRNGDCHDIQHMVTGFGPNTAGETALAVMNVTSNAQHFSPDLATMISMPNLFVTSVSFMRSGLHYGAGMPLLLEAQMLGIQAGRAINKPLLTVDWEDYLDWPLEDIATELGFARGPGEAWSHSHDVLEG
jgi:ubiquinone biosynthesis protein COQ4